MASISNGEIYIIIKVTSISLIQTISLPIFLVLPPHSLLEKVVNVSLLMISTSVSLALPLTRRPLISVISIYLIYGILHVVLVLLTLPPLWRPFVVAILLLLETMVLLSVLLLLVLSLLVLSILPVIPLSILIVLELVIIAERPIWNSQGPPWGQVYILEILEKFLLTCLVYIPG